jgi:adenosylcobinamide kinase/adenosylcobinamide-phosphate guanylyltransferase
MKTLLLGGARSGKSALAARWAAERASQVSVLVTGTASDPEMAARIAAHREGRPAHWRVREEPERLGSAVREEAEGVGTAGLLLVDCLTVWIANCLWKHSEGGVDEAGWQAERIDLIAALRTCNVDAIVVSNEVGTGIVPANAAARLFRDEQGWLNQAVATLCDEVYLVVAGLPLRLKPS